MKASSDKRKGATHLEQLVARNPSIGDDTPVTLEVLAKNTVVQLGDMIEIYNKASASPYEQLPQPDGLDMLADAVEAVELKSPQSPVSNVNVADDEQVKMFIENVAKKNSDVFLPEKKDGVKYKIKGFSTKNKTIMQGIELVDETDKLPVTKPKLVRQVGVYKEPPKPKDTRVFDQNGLLKVYEFVNRVERWRNKEIKTQPAPKKLSSKYAIY